jgi:hypothetical protein
MKHGLAAAGLGLLAVLCACGSGAAQRTPHVPAAPAGTATVLLGFANAAGGAAASSLGATDLSVRIVTPKQATRRIEPGEIPDGVWLGQLLTAAADSWRISGLPAGQQLLVQVGFALPGAAAPAMPAANRALLHFPVMVGRARAGSRCPGERCQVSGGRVPDCRPPAAPGWPRPGYRDPA